MSEKALHDDLVEYLREHPDGVSSRELAEVILKFKNPEQKIAHKMIVGILRQDRRCRLGADEKWFPAAAQDISEDGAIREMPWAAVYIVSDTAGSGNRILHISVWRLFETPVNLSSLWVVDPSTLSIDDREMCSPFDGPYEGGERAIQKTFAVLEDRIPVFLSARHQGMLVRDGMRIGESLTDDTVLTSHLMKMCGMAVPRTMTLEGCFHSVFQRAPVTGSAYRLGECFAECVWEVMRRLLEQGTISRRGLDRLEAEKILTAPWAAATFGLAEIMEMPQTPGVYGFKDCGGKFIYIGKAKSLRRRLKSYFKNIEEREQKLRFLHDQAHTLTVHRCGSELESLILEYRLIRKHKPTLNTQVSIEERAGKFSPLPDSIILLPHAEEDKGMSVWIRRDQKAVLKPFEKEFCDSAGLLENIKTFFFGPPPAPQTADFGELEIVHRWVKRHEKDLAIVPVYRCDSAEEVLEWMKSLWGDIQVFRAAS